MNTIIIFSNANLDDTKNNIISIHENYNEKLFNLHVYRVGFIKHYETFTSNFI